MRRDRSNDALRVVTLERGPVRFAEGTRLLQVADVSGVEQIEHAVGEDDGPAGSALGSRESRCFSSGEDWHGSSLPNRSDAGYDEASVRSCRPSGRPHQRN